MGGILLWNKEGEPPSRDRNAYQREYRKTPEGREMTRKYDKSPRGRVQKVKRDGRRYLTRPFVAWDGEGINDRYCLLASSAGDDLCDLDGLRTVDILGLLLGSARRNKRAIHVGYGLGYDCNFWLRDLDRETVETVYRNTLAKGVDIGDGFQVSWRPGKSFHVRRGEDSVTVYDVLPFFQCSFVKACDAYLGKDWDSREEIIADKARRATFQPEDLPRIREYNQAELRNLVSLMSELRSRLEKVGLRPGRWDGPGAIAAALLSQKGIKGAKSDPKRTPVGASYAVRTAYAGGRFELLRFGSVDLPAYEYDINSAYPSALRHVPCLAHGHWTRHDSDPGDRPFAIYHVRYRGPQDEKPAPLFRRSERGSISYPGTVDGWYWSPEVSALREYVGIRGPRGGRGVRGKYVIDSCWEWVADPEGCAKASHSTKPFEWIEGYYLKRQALKRTGDGAHVGIKLALNSLYGKLAQQVGWRIDAKGKLHIPPYHELAWAGYVTSHCRATVLRAAMLDLDAVIAFETDALFSIRPLPLDLGPGLGQWECTEFSSLAYCQSGTYFGRLADGTEIARTRGVDLGTVTRTDFENALQQETADDQHVSARLTRFVGAGLALQTTWDNWCRWVVTPKRVSAGPAEESKRCHYGCRNCKGKGIALGVWHETRCETPSWGWAGSYPYPVVWEDREAMPELEKLRTGHYEEWDGAE